MVKATRRTLSLQADSTTNKNKMLGMRFNNIIR